MKQIMLTIATLVIMAGTIGRVTEVAEATISHSEKLNGEVINAPPEDCKAVGGTPVNKTLCRI